MSLFLRRACCACLMVLFAAYPAATRAQESQELVDKSRLVLEKLLASADFTRLKAATKSAHGVLVFPSILKAGFIFGAEGGSGVLLTRDANGVWSYPAFYGMGAGSVGLQIGFQDSEAVFVINTLKGLNAVLNNNFKFGIDASIAAGPVGQGIEGSTTTALTADIEAYSKNRGLFAGGSLEGAVIYERDSLNKEYYGLGATGRTIAMDRTFKNERAEGLRAAATVK